MPEDPTKDCRDPQSHSNHSNIKKWGERYLPQFKSKVIDFALNNSIREAASQFKVNKGTIADWLRSVPKSKKTAIEEVHRPDLEFLEWLQTQRICSHFVTKEELNSKIEQLSSSDLGPPNANWFFKYTTRLKNKTATVKARISYPRKFKTEIAFLSTHHSKKKVAKIFKIDRKRITEWVECYVKEKKPEMTKREPKHYLTDEKVDGDIWDWYRQLSTKPNSREVREKALKMYHAAGHTGITCSTGWYYRWRKRYSLLKCTIEKTNQDTGLLIWVLGEFERNKTVLHVDLLNQAALQNATGSKPSPSWASRFSKRFIKILEEFPSPNIELPESLLQNCFAFQSMIADRKLAANLIIAFDEISLNFAPGSGKSVTLLRKSGFDNSHASLIVCCRADGTFLPTTIITKSPVEVEHSSSKIFNFVQDNGINDQTTMQQWIQSMLPYISRSSHLICDIYEPHLELEKLGGKQGFEVAIIPLGCTPKLQPISFGIGQKFKDEIEKQWFARQQESSWKSKSIKVPSSGDMFDWVQKAHINIENFENNFVQECFMKAGYFPSDY